MQYRQHLEYQTSEEKVLFGPLWGLEPKWKAVNDNVKDGRDETHVPNPLDHTNDRGHFI